MFAILRKAMEPSPVCRPSPPISPTLLPPLDDSPPPLLSYFKVEKEEDRESPIKEHRESEDPDHNENKDEVSPVKFEPRDDQTDSQMLKQRLEMYWKGMMKYHQQSQPEAKEAEEVKTEVKDVEVKTEPRNRPLQNLAGLSANNRLQPLKNGRNDHAGTFVPVTSDATSMPQSFLSQQTLAAMYSLQQMQRQLLSSKNTTLPNLLPPAPGFPATTSGALPRPINSNIIDKQPQSTSPPRHTMASTLPPTSVLNPFNHIKPVSKSPQPDNDMPLDLSLPASGNKRSHDGILKPTSIPSHRENKFQSAKDRKKLDDTALSSIQSNFPTLLNSNRAQARATQQAMLTAHIENGLSNESMPISTGPFTSLYQKQENVAPTNAPNLNDLMQGGVQPLQIQQWLMAAVSAQKMQQLALSHISMLQQQQQQQAVSHPDPPKKRPKLTDSPRLYSSLPQLPLPTISQQQPLFPQPLINRTPENRSFTPNSHPPTNRRSPKASSPTLSPDSNQSQSGKRYRRYAKPPYSYVSLITLSILSARDKKLRLSQILKRISEMFPFFNGSYQGWRDSVRHNLSQNECFVKVLKNPFRPTAKGNFWTVNLNSIPHELLLRQNTLVSRYAQDSGYRYRKDLSEVFDLRTGALKVSVPRHLLRGTSDPNASALSDDPAAVMEALLLVETSDDDTNDYKEKIAPEVRQFTLEDLFDQGDGGDEDSFSSGRNRGRNKQSTHALSHPPTLLPASFAQTLYHTANPALPMSTGIPTSMHSRSVEVQNMVAMGMLPQGMLSQSASHSPQIPIALSESAPNPFAAAQTALLSKALATTQLQGFDGLPSLQRMLYANRALQKQSFEPPVSNIPLMKTPTPPIPTAISPIPKRATPSPQHHDREDNDHSVLSDGSTSSKKHKRKAVHPTRHAGHSDATSYQNGMGDGSTSPRNAFVVPAMSRASSTPSRNISSEADSTSGNPFCSPVTSSSTKSHSSTSPRHDVSSEFEDNRHPPHTIYNAQPANGISSFQALQIFGASSLQASKMA